VARDNKRKGQGGTRNSARDMRSKGGWVSELVLGGPVNKFPIIKKLTANRLFCNYLTG
jgi:hypothetical protein